MLTLKRENVLYQLLIPPLSRCFFFALLILFFFTSRFHVNGRNDVYISYPSVVSANDGDFRVGRDPERPGPRMLMAHPKLWHSALSEAQVNDDYEVEFIQY